MTVQCINCYNWRPKDTEPRLYHLGMAVCKVHSLTKGHTFTAKYPRECAEFEQAPEAIVAKRERYDAKQV